MAESDTENEDFKPTLSDIIKFYFLGSHFLLKAELPKISDSIYYLNSAHFQKDWKDLVHNLSLHLFHLSEREGNKYSIL